MVEVILDRLREFTNQTDALLSSYDIVVQVKELHSKLRLAWLQYESCWAQVLSLIDKNDESYKRVSEQYVEQVAKKNIRCHCRPVRG